MLPLQLLPENVHQQDPARQFGTPTTIDEYYEVLKAFKEQDANGNGDPDDEIPLITAANGWHVQLDGFHAGKYPLPYHSGSLHQLLQKQKRQEKPFRC